MALPPEVHRDQARPKTPPHEGRPQAADIGSTRSPRESSGPSAPDKAEDNGVLSALDRLTLDLERIHSLLGDLRAVYRRTSRADSGAGWQPGEDVSNSTREPHPTSEPRPSGPPDPAGEPREATGEERDTRSARRPGVRYGGGPSAFTRK